MTPPDAAPRADDRFAVTTPADGRYHAWTPAGTRPAGQAGSSSSGAGLAAAVLAGLVFLAWLNRPEEPPKKRRA